MTRDEIALDPEPAVREIRLNDTMSEKLKELGSRELRVNSLIFCIIPLNALWVTFFDRELPRPDAATGETVAQLRADKLDPSQLYLVPVERSATKLHVFAPREDGERRLELIVIDDPDGVGTERDAGDFVGANPRGMFTRSGSVVTFHTVKGKEWVRRGVICGKPDAMERGVLLLSPPTAPEVRAHGALQKDLAAAAAEPRSFAASSGFFDEVAKVAALNLPETKALEAALGDVCAVQAERWAAELGPRESGEVQLAIASVAKYSPTAALRIAEAHSKPLRDELAAAAAEARSFAATAPLLERAALLLARSFPDAGEVKAAVAKVLAAHEDAWVRELAALAAKELGAPLLVLEKHSPALADRAVTEHVHAKLGLAAGAALDAPGVATALDGVAGALHELAACKGLERARTALGRELAASVAAAAERAEARSATRSALSAVAASLGSTPARSFEQGGPLLRFAVALDAFAPCARRSELGFEVRDASGDAILEADAPLVGAGDPWRCGAFRYFMRPDPNRALLWPLLIGADGSGVARPDGFLGLGPIPLPGQTRALGWVAIWRTAEGERCALLHAAIPGMEILDSRAEAIWSDAAIDVLRRDDPSGPDVRLELLLAPGSTAWTIYKSGERQTPYTSEGAADRAAAHAVVARLNAARDERRKVVEARLARERAEREQRERQAREATLAQQRSRDASNAVLERIKARDIAGARQTAVAQAASLGGLKLAIRVYVKFALDQNLGGEVANEDLYTAGDGADYALCMRCREQMIANSNRDAAASNGYDSGYSGSGSYGGSSSSSSPSSSSPQQKGAWDAARDKKIDDTIKKYSR